MFISIKHRLEEPDITELLSYSVFPEPERQKTAMERYRSDEQLELFGLESEGEVVGLIGFRIDEEKRLLVEHIAVRPDCRGAGFGRGLLLEAISLMQPTEVLAETDEEAIEFYRRVGFEVVSLGEKFPSVERFACRFTTK